MELLEFDEELARLENHILILEQELADLEKINWVQIGYKTAKRKAQISQIWAFSCLTAWWLASESNREPTA